MQVYPLQSYDRNTDKISFECPLCTKHYNNEHEAQSCIDYHHNQKMHYEFESLYGIGNAVDQYRFKPTPMPLPTGLLSNAIMKPIQVVDLPICSSCLRDLQKQVFYTIQKHYVNQEGNTFLLGSDIANNKRTEHKFCEECWQANAGEQYTLKHKENLQEFEDIPF